ncbi:MAG: hypothetical protein IJP93_09215 [Bacteroidales bacterium]|nr:hypothetical protein [Bacteroidales bacterium]
MELFIEFKVYGLGKSRGWSFSSFGRHHNIRPGRAKMGKLWEKAKPMEPPGPKPMQLFTILSTAEKNPATILYERAGQKNTFYLLSDC